MSLLPLVAALSTTHSTLAGEVPASTRTVMTMTSASDGRARSVEIRVENDKVMAKVDGTPLDASRIRREGERIVLLEPDGTPMANVPQFSMTDGGPAAVRVGGRSVFADEIVIDGADGRLTIGPRIQAEIDKAMRQVDDVLLQRGEAGELLRRFVIDAGLAQQAARARAPQATEMAMTRGRTAPKVMLGVTLQDPEPALCRHLGIEEGQATLLTEVVPGLPADKAGLRTFDIVLEVDGRTPADPARIREAIASRAPGERVDFLVRRPGGGTQRVEVPLDAFDPARLGERAMIQLQFDTNPLIESLEGLRGQLRMAPLDAERGDFLFELTPPTSWFVPPAPAPDRLRSPGGRVLVQPPLPPPPLPPLTAEGAAEAARDARLERLERRFEELSQRMEQRMDRLMDLVQKRLDAEGR